MREHKACRPGANNSDLGTLYFRHATEQLRRGCGLGPITPETTQPIAYLLLQVSEV